MTLTLIIFHSLETYILFRVHSKDSSYFFFFMSFFGMDNNSLMIAFSLQKTYFNLIMVMFNIICFLLYTPHLFSSIIYLFYISTRRKA